MGIKLANNVSTTLAAGIDAVATTLFVTSDTGILARRVDPESLPPEERLPEIVSPEGGLL